MALPTRASLDAQQNWTSFKGWLQNLWDHILTLPGPSQARGAWAPAEDYLFNDYVVAAGASYICLIPLTAGAVFATDLAAVRWLLSAGLTAAQLASADGSAAIGHNDGGVGDVTITVAQYIKGTINPKRKGLDPGNTGANNAAAINACLAMGKHVEVWDADALAPYPITGSLTMTTPKQALVFQSRNTILQAQTDVDLLVLNGSHWAEVRSGQLLGVAAGTTSTSAGIRVIDASRVLLYNPFCRLFGYGYRAYGATGANDSHTLINPYFQQNQRVALWALGHAGHVVGGELSGSILGMLEAGLLAGAKVNIDRDAVNVIGQDIVLEGTIIQGIGTTIYNVTNAVNSAGLIRLTIPGHGRSTGDYISIAGVGGTVEANGVWPMTRIDDNTVDLKTSAHVNAFTTAGTMRFGVALYWQVGQMGPNATGIYMESVPVGFHAGDSFQNDGTTAHSAIVAGGTLSVGSFGAADLPACLIANNRLDQFNVLSAVGSGTDLCMVNSRGANFSGVIDKGVNRGFTHQFENTGSQSIGGRIYTPLTKNNDIVRSFQIPTSASDPTLVTTLTIGKMASVIRTIDALHGMRVISNLELGSAGVVVLTGTGSPEGAKTAVKGSEYIQTNAADGTCAKWEKRTGTGNTGWVLINV